MIRPTKYLNLDFSLIKIAAILINEFKEQPVITYDELFGILLDRIGKSGKEIMPYALNFLFLIGKLEYHQAIDAFEFKRHHEAK